MAPFCSSDTSSAPSGICITSTGRPQNASVCGSRKPVRNGVIVALAPLILACTTS